MSANDHTATPYFARDYSYFAAHSASVGIGPHWGKPEHCQRRKRRGEGTERCLWSRRQRRQLRSRAAREGQNGPSRERRGARTRKNVAGMTRRGASWCILTRSQKTKMEISAQSVCAASCRMPSGSVWTRSSQPKKAKPDTPGPSTSSALPRGSSLCWDWPGQLPHRE